MNRWWSEGRIAACTLAALTGIAFGGLTGAPALAFGTWGRLAPLQGGGGEPGFGPRGMERAGPSHSMERIAANVRAAYEKLQGLSMSFKQVNSWADMPESGEVSEGKLWVARGGKLRMEYTEPPGHLLVSDGTRVWVYVPENNQAVVDSVGADGQSALAEMLLQDLDAGDAELLGEERSAGAMCYVILMEGLEDPQGLESLKIWVDPRSWLTRALELADVNGNVTKFSFSDIKKLKEIGEDVFEFNAPPGVEVVESPLTEGGSR